MHARLPSYGCWLLVAGFIVVLADASWRSLLLLAGCLLALLAFALCSSDGSARTVARWILPVWGDLLRNRKRKARRRGNKWLRESGLVHDSADAVPVNYEVYEWPDQVEILDLDAYGVTDERVRKAVRESLSYWHAMDYEIERTGSTGWIIRLYDVPRLDSLRVPRVLDELPEALGRIDADGGHVSIRVGRVLSGDAWLDFSGVAGILLAGQPGMGKTNAVNIILSALIARPDLADVYVLDGKGGEDLKWAQPVCKRWSNDDGFAESLDMLRSIHALMKERLQTNRQRYGDSNGWHVYGRSDLKLVVMVIDEVQSYTGAVSKESKELQAEFVRLLTDIIKKGRSACVAVVCATQKPTIDAMPSSLRDEMAKRYCFRVSTSDMARAALGVIPDDGPSPVDIPFAAKGLAVGTSDDGGLEYVQFDHLPESVIDSLLGGSDES